MTVLFIRENVDNYGRPLGSICTTEGMTFFLQTSEYSVEQIMPSILLNVWSVDVLIGCRDPNLIYFSAQFTD